MKKILLILILFLFEIKFVSILDEKFSTYIIFFTAIYQLIFFLSLILIWRGKIIIFANTLLLFLTINLFIGEKVLDSFNTYRTLEPNINKQVQILGDTMPGFEGVNTLTTDFKGFRVTKKINYKDQKSLRIFAIGGSTTIEQYLDDNETWTARLEKLLEPNFKETVEIINTGVSGLRSIHHYSTLLKTENYHPNFYIFLVGMNDWNHHIKKVLGGNKKFFLSDTFLYRLLQENKKYINQIFLSSNKKNNEIKLEYGEYYSSQNNTLLRETVKKMQVKNVDEGYLKYMTKISLKCKNKKYKCIFLTQPTAYSKNVNKDLKERFWMTPPNTEYTLDLESLIQIASFYNNWLVQFSKKNNIFVCDLDNKLDPTTKIFYDEAHYNEYGSSQVAKIIYDCIKNFIIK